MYPLSSVDLKSKHILSPNCKILQESNGLMLCESVTSWDRYQGSLSVLNTNTGRKVFPSSVEAREGNANAKRSKRTILRGYVQKMSTTMAFDPLMSPASFQLISIWSHRDDLNSNYRIEVYTSKTDNWRLCYRNQNLVHHLDITPTNSILMKPGVYWNNSVNWLNTDGGLVFYKIGKKLLNSVAPPLAQSYTNCYFDQCRGDLILVQISISAGTLKVFDMNLDHSGWGFKHSIELHLMSPEFPGSAFRVLLADIGEDSESVYLVAKGSRLFSINQGKMLVRDLGVQLQNPGSFNTFKYIDTIPDCCFAQAD
ncbi:uncharacterized protein LOC113339402 [Papaver somniferum]|uniref:uncharacterized protein LOC113339402 n=1 Tax=Papaver somniferum TaxID=3469 RepID=UPI000E6FBE1C|nr:uncharacterized protein LOC113339402 [Papaver somniferum]